MQVNRIAQILCALALTCGCVFGQSATGTLQGTVLDPVGAAVPGVTVVIKNPATGATRNTVSGEDGTFILNSVDAATYDLTITAKAGFKTYAQKGVAVTTNERRDVGRITLELGALTEQVTVEATATPIQTASGENSKLIEGSQLANITLKGRDMFAILQTIPGISFGNALLTGSGGDATSNASGTFGSMQINGGGTARSNFTVDGVVNVDNGNNAQVDFMPTMDTIAEIRVLTTNYQAEFGHSSSGQISLVTKGGSSSFHGTGFFNKRHEMFNANTFFRNLSSTPKSLYRFGVGGYTIGGPVYIPKVFNTDKTKVFFFFSQEYTSQKPSSTEQTAMVPTAAQLQGNFFDRCQVGTGVGGVTCIPAFTDNNGNNRNTFLVDPTNGKQQLLSGNVAQLVGSSVYNASAAKYGQAILKYLPSPNLCTAAAGIYNGAAISPSNCPSGFSNHAITNPSWNYNANYIWSAAEEHPRRNDTLRIDWNVTQTLRSFFRYSQDYDRQKTGLGLPVRDSSGSYEPFSVDFNKPGHGYAVGLTYTISPTMVNEFTFGKIWNGIGWYVRNESQVDRANMGNPPSFNDFSKDPLFVNDTGKRWLATEGPQNFANYVPQVSFGSASGRTESAPSTNPCWNSCPYTNWAESWSFADSLSKVYRKHNLKVGAYVERTDKVQVGSQGAYLGNYAFGNDSNNPLDTGDGYANAWLGNYRQYSEGAKNLGDWWFWQVELFAQDSWRVNNRLTLDLGVRFYGMPPITNTNTGRNASAEFVRSAYDHSKVMRLYQGACVNPTTNTVLSTASGPCPSNAVTRAWDPATNTLAIQNLINTFVPDSVAHYPSGATMFPGMLVAGTDERLPQGLYTVPRLSPAFRFGFAWDVFGNGKTAIRGGVGQFLNRLSYNQIASPISFPPILTSLNFYYGNIADIANPATKSQGAISPGGMNADFTGHQQNESAYNGSFMVQQSVGFSTVLEASWVFNLRRHIPYNLPLLYYPLYWQFDHGAEFVNPQQAYLQNNALTGYAGGNSGLGMLGGQYVYSPSVCPTCVSSYTNISAQSFEETANYHALQINVRRNMTRGLSFGWSFTWNKGMSNPGANLNNNDPASGRSPIFPDKFRNWGPYYSPTPVFFTFNAVYEIPNLGKKLNFKPLGWVTDNWTLSGLYQWRSNSVTGVPNPGFANTNSNCSTAATCYPEWNWTGSNVEGRRALITGDYSLSAVGEKIQINPGNSTVATNTGTPSTPSYPLLGTDGNRIINTAAFTIPFPCSQTAASDPHYGIGKSLDCLGNAGPGQLVNVPGTRVSNLDMSIAKNIPLRSEGRFVQFRAEVYNLPNHTQFSGYNITPSYDWRNWLQGRLIQTNANLNRMNATLNPRQMSMSLRLVF
jgi:hypothetical protein